MSDDVQLRVLERREKELKAQREEIWSAFLETDDAKMRLESVQKSLEKSTLEALRDDACGEDRFGTYLGLLTKGWFEEDGSFTQDDSTRETKIMRQIFWDRCWSIFDNPRSTFKDLGKPLGEQADRVYYEGIEELVDKKPEIKSFSLSGM